MSKITIGCRSQVHYSYLFELNDDGSIASVSVSNNYQGGQVWKFDKNEPLNSLNLFHNCEGARRVWGGTYIVAEQDCAKELDAMTVAYYKTLELYDE